MKTRYDVWGVVGELLGWKWLNSKKHDFCSEQTARTSAGTEVDI